jgi:hypothetical protein
MLMSYPSLEQYNEAFQHPKLSLVDPELKDGAITTTGLGLPLALCGGFALTYTVKANGKKFAVRCFHKKSIAIEQRYSAISRKIASLKSPYFLDFQFQPRGVKVAGQSYPIVKMAWASGTTLGEFMETNYRKSNELSKLSTSLQSLAKYLKDQNVAHGDIQPGNVMVASGGAGLQLIDYDGMYVEDLRSLGSAELGHRNFQHPKRSATTWDPSIDRFSFISIDLALRALQSSPGLWGTTRSDGDSILFKANDFADPGSSQVFRELFSKPSLAEDAKNFAAICKAPYEKIPTLEDFLAKKNIPQIAIAIASATKPTETSKYLSAFPVLDASQYAECLAAVGEKVELIGKIVEVKEDKTRYGKSYIFINFGPWKGKIVKVSIWSEGLAALAKKPDKSWEGKWVSVTGLMEPPYTNKKYGYSHLSISITQGSQIHQISEKEAKFRLAGSTTRSAGGSSGSGNQRILEEMQGGAPRGGRSTAPKPTAPQPVSPNAAILEDMKKTQSGTRTPVQSPKSTQYKNQKSDWCFIATSVYGSDAPETNSLRLWRDEVLLPKRSGRLFVKAYYLCSPYIAGVIRRSPRLKASVRLVLDRFVGHISK